MSQLVEDVEQLVTPWLDEEGFELVDITYQKGPQGWILCLFIDKPGGVTLTDCEACSRGVENLLDQKDLIPHSYSLEVSSPGVQRPLRRLKDFKRFIGERVHVKLYAAIDGQKNFHGILRSATEDTISVELEDKEEEKTFTLSQVAKSTLDPVVEI